MKLNLDEVALSNVTLRSLVKVTLALPTPTHKKEIQKTRQTKKTSVATVVKNTFGYFPRRTKEKKYPPRKS